ncbi:MAG: hypothetical protein GF353_04745 [Candidatus Lokiarchaeota archaeon]|nr:hypothetical protein [Candidatus Lokiarchaeota archaeon]
MKIIKILGLIFISFFIIWILYSPTPQLHKAVKSKDTNLIKELLNSGTDVNLKNRKGISALHIASEFGTYEIVKLLIKYGADVNANTNYDVTPLHFAAQGGDTEIANLLISMGAKVNSEDNEGRTPLSWIVRREYASRDMIDLLELHEDANEIWSRVKSKEDYKRIVILMKKMNNDEFNNMHMINRTPQEIHKYLDILLNLR